MNCEEMQDLMHAYVDRELDLIRSLELEHHLGDCDACSEELAGIRRLRSQIGFLYQMPQPSLERRVRSAVRKADRSSQPGWFSVRALAVAAAALFVAVIGLGVLRFTTASRANDVLASEVVASHVRSMMADHLTDVSSSDQHTVKPWFGGKLDFSPVVSDFANEGFPLVGGRLDYLDGRPVAALVYKRRQHYINLFVWPSSAESESADHRSRQGFNVVHWGSSGMSWWAVSDLNESELQQFADLAKGE
ncbi:MAG TPA: anti-sigma factor [Blastocatellia bacterium]|nr:anti-sigma factor [Blastocatellia bacterium]